MGRFDRLLLSVAPAWARRRAENRLRFEVAEMRRDAVASTYGAAERSRLTSDWRAPNTSADSAIVGDLQTINSRARQAVRDDWAAASLRDAYRRHIVGTGITCRSAARNPDTGDPLESFNKVADALWQEWCRAKWCDIERRKSFTEMQGLMISEFATVGQGLVVMHEDTSRRKSPSTVLQAIEPEMLDVARITNPENGNQVRNGVEIDQFGAPVAYWVFIDHHPLDGMVLRGVAKYSVRVEASRVCQVMRQERPRQTHGVSRFAPILKKLRHLGMYDEYQIVAARLQACQGLFIKTSLNADGDSSLFGLRGQSGESTKDSNNNPEVNFEPGMVHYGKPGEEPVFLKPESPGEYYEPFSKRQLSSIAAGGGLDYPTVSRDFSGNTFSGQRQGMIERDYETDPLQQLLIDLFCIPVRDQVISMAVMQGLIDAPEFYRDPRMMMAYLQADWRPQAKPWVDPQNQASAAEIALRNNLVTHRALLNEQGEDWRETFQQIADEERMMQSLGISESADPTPQPPAPTGTDPVLDRIKAEADAYGVAVRAGVITPQTDDENLFRSRLGLPAMSADARRAWSDDQGVRRPITLVPPGGQAAAVAVPQPPTDNQNGDNQP